MKILIINRVYLLDQNGGAKCSLGNCRAIASLYDDAFFLYPERENKPMPKLLGEHVTYYPCVDHRSNIQKGLDIWRGRLHRFTDIGKEIISNNNFDIIFFDSSVASYMLLSYIKKKSNAKVVTIHHNVEKFYIRDNPDTLLIRWPSRHFHEKAEVEALLHSDLNLTLTEHDKDIFIQWYPQLKGRIECFEAFLGENNNSKDVLNKELDFNNLVITGALYFKQSSMPVLSFLNDIWKKCKAKFPDIKLTIAGRNPSSEINRICSSLSDVKLISNPTDMQPILDNAGIYICPTDMGSGMKFRVLDGLKNGMPVICHDKSIYGYESLVDKNIVYPYHDTDSFIEALTKVKKIKKGYSEILAAYEDQFSLESGTSRIKKILKNNGLL